VFVKSPRLQRATIKSSLKQNIDIKVGLSKISDVSESYEFDNVTSENVDSQIISFFSRLGCSVIEGYDENTSFLSDNQDEIENPNIASPIISKNTKIGTKKSFSDDSDPFFNIDKQLPQSKSNSMSIDKVSISANKIRVLVTDVTELNINILPSQTIKQFNK